MIAPGRDIQVRLPRERGADPGVRLAGDFERPEAPAEGGLLLVVEALIVKHQDRILVESGADFGEGFFVHRRAGIDPGNLGAEQRMQWRYRDRHSDLLWARRLSVTAAGSNEPAEGFQAFIQFTTVTARRFCAKDASSECGTSGRSLP